MPSTCQTIHYDASQYRVYIPVHYFSLVIPSPPQKYPCLPCSLPSLLPCSSIRTVAPSLPAPSFLRSLSPSFISLAPSMPRFVPSSLVPFQRDTYGSDCTKKTIINPPSTFPPYLHSRSLAVSHHLFLPPSRPIAPSVPPTFCSPSPLPCLTSSLPPCLPPLAPSVPPTLYSPSLLPCPSLPACLLPCNSIYTVCVYSVGELHWVLCREGPARRRYAARRGTETMEWSRH